MWSPPGRAQVSGSLSVTNDELWRGRSLSAGRPAATVAASYDDKSGFYVDASATGALVGGGAELIGLAADAGYAWRLKSGPSLDVGVTHRQFTRYFSGGRAAGYSEVYAGISGKSLSARLHYSPDYFRSGFDVLYGSVEGVIRPAQNWRLLGHAGAIAYLSGPPVARVGTVQYDYSLGVARQLGRIELKALWSNGGPDPDYFGGRPHDKGRLVVSLSVGF